MLFFLANFCIQVIVGPSIASAKEVSFVIKEVLNISGSKIISVLVILFAKESMLLKFFVCLYKPNQFERLIIEDWYQSN